MIATTGTGFLRPLPYAHGAAWPLRGLVDSERDKQPEMFAASGRLPELPAMVNALEPGWLMVTDAHIRELGESVHLPGFAVLIRNNGIRFELREHAGAEVPRERVVADGDGRAYFVVDAICSLIRIGGYEYVRAERRYRRIVRDLELK